MNKLILKTTLIAASLSLSTVAFAEGSLQHFGESAQHLKNSTQHSAGSVGHTLVGSGKLVSAAVAVPFKVIGKTAAASEAIGDLLWDSATGGPALEVSDNTITAGPAPTVAINL